VKFLCTLWVIALVIAGYWYLHRPITYPPGALIAAEPDQLMLPKGTPAFAHAGFSLRPLALFSIDARVLHRKNYRYDNQAALVPVDLALGWGPMSDQSVLDHISISQSMRFFWFEYRQPPIPKEQIISHSTNVHIIPSTNAIASRCKALREGALIHLKGDLVEASGPGITSWASSLSRTDTGNGACELMWVTELTILRPQESAARPAIAKR
jgi:hypothetical protein